MVFYRKYRPQTIDDLDSRQVREALTAVLATEEPAHAFLFTGPKGLGKTSTARIVAKVVNCENRKDTKSLEPCNTCDHCISITNGSYLDVQEIDAASNRGIDEIRDLKEKIKLSPISAKKKVYIIDEVHMLTTEAFNALLKTLEEPPSHAMFILCTTELQKVPATILSRCFNITFHPATKEEIARSFKRIAEGEKLDIQDEAIDEILKLADGGFRDAHKILEELVRNAKDNIISKTLVEERYKTTTVAHSITEMLDALNKHDVSQSLQLISDMGTQGVDIKFFFLQLIETLHNLLLKKLKVEGYADSLDSTLTVDEIRSLLMLFNRAYGEVKYAVVPQLPFELAIIEWIQNDATNIEKEAEVTVTQGETQTTVRVADNAVTVASMRKHVGNLARVKALYGEPKQASVRRDATEGNPRINLLQVSNSEITKDWLDTFWSSFIEEMKLHNHTIAGVLRGCMLKSFDNKQLIIETSYKFHKEKLDDGKIRGVLAQACKTLTGNPIEVTVVLRK